MTPGSTVEEAPAQTLPAARQVRQRPQEIDLLELLLSLAERKKLILRTTAVVAFAALLTVLCLPNWYTGTAVILPPQQAQSSLGAVLGQLGAIAGMAGAKADLGLKNPADLYVGILRSQSIADALITRHGLLGVYGHKRMEDARKSLARHTSVSAGKEGLIEISVEDRDPRRAAALANGYVEELYNLNARLALTEAGQRRLFFETQLETARNELTEAEVGLKQAQEKTGLIQLDAQAKSIIEGTAKLKAEIAAKEVELHAMRSFATDNNPDVKLAQEQLAALRSQVAKAERIGGGDGDFQIATTKVPEAAMEYARRYRRFKYNEMIYELLTKQFEAAKLDEARSAAVIQVIDRATPAEKKSSPARALIVLIAMAASLVLTSGYVLVCESLKAIALDPERRSTLESLKAHLSHF